MRFGYNEEGILVKFENSAVLNDEQLIYVRNHFPFVIDELQTLAGKTGMLTEVTDISFDRFWTEYNYKKGKIAAFKEWKKLSSDEMVKAIVRIKPYRFDCKCHNREMVYPERYLKDRRFDDE